MCLVHAGMCIHLDLNTIQCTSSISCDYRPCLYSAAAALCKCACMMQAEAVATIPGKTEASAKKPAAAAKAKPAPKKAAPGTKARAELIKKAAKAAKENSGPKVKRAKSAFMFFSADRWPTVKGVVVIFPQHPHVIPNATWIAGLCRQGRAAIGACFIVRT